jgi:lipopolysaccharide/colanic/teichoic acid biosynthesis glycosyltransferase
MSSRTWGQTMVSIELEGGEEATSSLGPFLRSTALLLCTLAVAGSIGMFYSGVFLLKWNVLNLPPEYQTHLSLVLGCLCTVLLFAFRAHGALDRKVTETVIVTTLIHGILAFLILGGRWYFSRSILIANFNIALVLGVAVVLLKHRIASPRVAIVRPLALDVNLPRPLGEVINSPSADLSSYDIILVSFTDSISNEWARALSKAMLAGSQVRHVGEYVEDVRGAVSVDHFELDQVKGVGLVSYRSVKRLADIATVVFVSPVIVGLIALGALGILLTMGGPVFFVQERVGLAGKPFRMWKLRTMLPAQPGESHRAAVPGDRRITRLGVFLRRFRIDELPQVWNVLRGEMSVIGPRPEAVPFHDDYVRDVPEYAYRNLVRPGITGWAQVCAPPSANANEARRKLSYDLYYVKRMSLFLDLQIALRTIWTVTNGGGVR